MEISLLSLWELNLSSHQEWQNLQQPKESREFAPAKPSTFPDLY